jgi:hypothetical protein
MSNLKIGAEVPVSEIRAGMNQSAEAVQEATRRMQIHFTELEHTSGESMKRSREAVKLAASEMGIHMDRALTGIVAKSQTIGPAIAAAFNVTAALAFIGILVSMKDKIADAAKEMGGFTSAMREFADEQSRLNRLAVESFTSVTGAQKALQGINSRIDALEKERAAQMNLLDANKRWVALSGYAAAEWGSAYARLKDINDQLFDKEKGLYLQRDRMIGRTTKLTEEMMDRRVRGAEEARQREEEAMRAGAAARERDSQIAAEGARTREAYEAAINAQLVSQGALYGGILEGINKEKQAVSELLTQQGAEWIRQQEQRRAMAAESAAHDIRMIEMEMEAKRRANTLTVEEERRYQNRIFEIQRAAIKRKVEFLNENDPDTPEKKRKLLFQLEEIEKEHQLRQTIFLKSWGQTVRGALTEISSMFADAVIGWMQHFQTFGQAMAQLWNSIASMVLRNVFTVILAMELETNATKREAAKQVFIKAKAAAASVFHKVMEALPFPADVIVAPIAAAGVFASMMAFATFNKGGLVPGQGNSDTVPALLTPGEVVLPRQLAGPGLALLTGNDRAGSGSRGTVNVHQHNNFSALDGKSVGRVVRKSRRELEREFRRLGRNGAFRFAR